MIEIACAHGCIHKLTFSAMQQLMENSPGGITLQLHHPRPGKAGQMNHIPKKQPALIIDADDIQAQTQALTGHSCGPGRDCEGLGNG